MGLLDEIIDGASSDAVNTTNLLRKVQTLAHRIGAVDLTAWARAELQGYEAEAAIPTYRGPFTTHVFGVYSGPFNSGGENTVSPTGVPADYLGLFQVGWRVSIAEIESLSRSTEEVVQPWDPHSVAKYNEWIDAGRVPRVPMFYLYSARKVISTAMLGSIVEAVRTKALELALDLQSANPAAGEVNGPTVADPGVYTAVTTNTFYIHGSGTNVALGTGITQASTVSKGDLAGLAKALADLIKDQRPIGEVLAVVTSDGTDKQKRSKLRAIADAVRAGSFAIGTGATADVAADGVMDLAHHFLGW